MERFFYCNETGIIFGIARFLTGEKEKIKREDYLQIALSGFLGLTLYFTIENPGVSMTTASNAALIVASFPAVTILLEFFLYHSKPTVKKVLGIIMALIGVSILTRITVEGNSTYNLGLRKLSASVSVSLMNLVPIFGLLFSITILGEEVSAIQLFGVLIVILGVALSAYPQASS